MPVFENPLDETPLSRPMRRAWLPPDRRSAVYRRGNVVMRETGPWAPTVHSFLRHLERVGFAGSPRVVGTGFMADGRETLSYIEGEFVHPGPWTLEGAAALGRFILEFHNAARSFTPPPDAVWPPWFGRCLGGAERIIGHCDIAPWNIVSRHGVPVALIDWEVAGPIDPLIELAQACWLNAKLHDDIVAELDGLPPLVDRARQLNAMLDGYQLSTTRRVGFIDRMLDYIIHETAEQANEARVMPGSTDPEPLWALAWRARAAAWISRNQQVLYNAII